MRELLDHEIHFINGGESYSWWQATVLAGSATFIASGLMHGTDLYGKIGLVPAAFYAGLSHGLWSSIPTLIVAGTIVLMLEAASSLGLLGS